MTKASEQIPGLFRRRILFVTEHFTCIRQKHGGELKLDAHKNCQVYLYKAQPQKENSLICVDML